MTGRPAHLTELDIPRIRELMEKMDLPTKKLVAQKLGIKERTFRTFTRKYGVDFPVQKLRRPTRANGVIGELFHRASASGHSVRQIAKALDTSEPRVHAWRMAQRDMPVFMVQCFANLLNLEIILTPREPH